MPELFLRFLNSSQYPANSPPDHPRIIDPVSVSDDGNYASASPLITGADSCVSLLMKYNPEYAQRLLNIKDCKYFKIVFTHDIFQPYFIERIGNMVRFGYTDKGGGFDPRISWIINDNGSWGPYAIESEWGMSSTKEKIVREMTMMVGKSVYYLKCWERDVSTLQWSEGSDFDSSVRDRAPVKTVL